MREPCHQSAKAPTSSNLLPYPLERNEGEMDGEKRKEEGGRDRVGRRGKRGEGGGMREHERMRAHERMRESGGREEQKKSRLEGKTQSNNEVERGRIKRRERTKRTEKGIMCTHQYQAFKMEGLHIQKHTHLLPTCTCKHTWPHDFSILSHLLCLGSWVELHQLRRTHTFTHHPTLCTTYMYVYIKYIH